MIEPQHLTRTHADSALRATTARDSRRRLLAAVMGITAVGVATSLVEDNWLWHEAGWKPALLTFPIACHLIELLCIGCAIGLFYAAIRYMHLWSREDRKGRAQTSMAS